MIFDTKLSLFTIFLLIAIIHDASSCAHSPGHRRKRHYLSGLDNTIGDDTWTSCGQNLCTSTDNYPENKIHSTVVKFQRLTQSDKSLFKRIYVDSGYMQQLANGINYEDKHEDSDLQKYNCNTEANIIYPLEGQSSDDNEIYYIINTKGFSQSVQQKTCESCNPADRSVYCEQETREQKLLVIPARKGSFTAEDVTVKSFEVPSGCACYKLPTAIHV